MLYYFSTKGVKQSRTKQSKTKKVNQGNLINSHRPTQDNRNKNKTKQKQIRNLKTDSFGEKLYPLKKKHLIHIPGLS